MTSLLFRRTLVDARSDTTVADVPIALAHGFTQNSQCWGGFAHRLGDTPTTGREVISIDAPGHGESGHDDDDLAAAGARLVATGGRADWIGYSMGGRMLLHAALENRGAMVSLVLIGATGGIDGEAERQARRERDEQLAERIERVGTESFIDEWLATPLFAHLGQAACRNERLANRAAGMANSLRSCGTGTQLPLWDRLHAIDIPTLIIAGTNDHKFTELGHRLVDSIGANSSFAAVSGGHAVHLENPAGTAAQISLWQAQVARRP